MSSRTVFLRTIVVVAALAASAGKLDAADLGSLFSDTPQTNIPPVEFGTGWYLRGDAGFAEGSMPNLSPDLSQFFSNAWQATANLDLGFGYKFNSWLRADAVVDWWNPTNAGGIAAEQTCAGVACTPNYSSSVQRWDALVNLYADVGTWFGVTPYIGGGAGLSLTPISGSVNWDTASGTIGPITVSDARYQFAWAAMAGFSYAFSSNILLDIGYRYINLGTISSLPSFSGSIASKTIYDQEIRVGIRYMID